jgi:hypothetical protein
MSAELMIRGVDIERRVVLLLEPQRVGATSMKTYEKFRIIVRHKCFLSCWERPAAKQGKAFFQSIVAECGDCFFMTGQLFLSQSN